MTRKKVSELAYGDLFDLAELAPHADVDDHTLRVSEVVYARAQSESYYEGGALWLDTSFGFFRLNPDVEVDVHRNEPHPFGSRSRA